MRHAYAVLRDISRAMSRDSGKYKDPEVFSPERFFDENGDLNDDDVRYAFGFGRR